jgi:hypothetical protein
MLLTTERRRGSAETTHRLFIAPADTAGSERRRGLRLRQQRPVKIYEPVTSRYIGGQTEDVSATGLRVSLPASACVRPGTVLNIHVGVSAGGQPLANRRQMMAARVVWVEGAGELRLGRMCAGIEFTASIAAHLDAA